MTTLYQHYKKNAYRKYAPGGSLFDLQTDPELAMMARDPASGPVLNSGGGESGVNPGVGRGAGFGQMAGFAATLGAGIIDATAKPDPVSGRISTGATVGKSALSGAAAGASLGPMGALAGGVLGAGLGLITAGKEKKQARQMLSQRALDTMRQDADRSSAMLATNPELLTGFKNSSYFAMGGEMMGGMDPNEDPNDPGKKLKTRPLQNNERVQWNQYLDFVKSKGYEGSEELNSRDKRLGENLFNEFRKSNKGVTIGYDIVPSVQQEMQQLKDQAQGFAKRRNSPDADKIMAGVSPVDGWFGSKTSQYRFPQMSTQTYNNGQLVEQKDLGLVNSQLKPTGAGATPGTTFVNAPKIPQGATIQKLSDGDYYEDPQSGDLVKIKMATGGGIHIKPENRGKFTASASRAGMGVQAFASKVLANKDNYSSTLVKRANFAKNASKWSHEDGGPIRSPLMNMYMTGGYATSLSSDGTEFHGNTHAQGGIDIPGAEAEVEDNETSKGNFIFSDKLGFAQVHKRLASAKGKIEKKPATAERVTSIKLLNDKENKLMTLQEMYKRQHQIA